MHESTCKYIQISVLRYLCVYMFVCVCVFHPNWDITLKTTLYSRTKGQVSIKIMALLEFTYRIRFCLELLTGLLKLLTGLGSGTWLWWLKFVKDSGVLTSAAIHKHVHVGDKPVPDCQSCICAGSSGILPPNTAICWWCCSRGAPHSGRISLWTAAHTEAHTQQGCNLGVT